VALTFSTGTLPAAFDGFPHGVIVSREDGAILFANESAGTIFACSPARLIGQPTSRLLDDAVAANDPWLELWKNPAQAPITFRSVAGKRSDGVMVPLEVRLNRLLDGAARCAVALITDITEKLSLEARVAHATEGDLDFHRLIVDVASRFVAIDAEAVDDAIGDSMRRIGEALTLDRAILWTKEPGESVAVPTHYWERPAGGSPPGPVPLASIPFVTSRLRAGEVNWFSNLDEVPDPVDRETFRSRGLRAAIWVPLMSTNDPRDKLSVLAFSSTARDHEWTPSMIGRLALVAGVMGQALARKASHQALQGAFDEIDQLRDRLSPENVESRREKQTVQSSLAVVADSPPIQQVLVRVAQVAPTPATVLLLGETGTGKDVIAQAIHDASPRRQRPMVRVSCAAIPTALIESELFGRERGAFTGALSRQIGRFEAANQSTLFLDEIGELPTEVQVKLLRVLQERVIERLGSPQPIKVDVRIIAATNRNLETAVEDKTFRADLYYRLNVFPITIPPLRERVDDIPALVETFIAEFSRAFGKPIERISKESMRELQSYSWPGNVRELRNVIERAVIVAPGRTLVVSAPRRVGQRPPHADMTLVALEVEHIRAVLKSTNWRVRGPGGAAERLGLKPTTLESRMTRYGLTRKQIE
jgi:PAS domain S-box-containing protein